MTDHLEEHMEELMEEQPKDPEEAGWPDQDSKDDPEEVQQGEDQPQTNQVKENAIITKVSKSQRRTHKRECWNCLRITNHFASTCPKPRRR